MVDPTMLFPSKIKIFNHDIKVFKPPVKDYHFAYSFYSVEELFATAISKVVQGLLSNFDIYTWLSWQGAYKYLHKLCISYLYCMRDVPKIRYKLPL
jgi:hypothetical protein